MTRERRRRAGEQAADDSAGETLLTPSVQALLDEILSDSTEAENSEGAIVDISPPTSAQASTGAGPATAATPSFHLDATQVARLVAHLTTTAMEQGVPAHTVLQSVWNPIPVMAQSTAVGVVAGMREMAHQLAIDLFSVAAEDPAAVLERVRRRIFLTLSAQL